MRARILVVALVVVGCDVGSVPPVGDGAGAGGDAGLPPPGGRYHPAGFAEAAQHGMETKMQVQDCRSCHGADLAGTATAPACDGCHQPILEPTAWRTNCTFCHGGTDDPTGAPPRNLDGTLEAAAGVFPPHGAHVREGLARGFDCVECHVKTADVLGEGHVFDMTPRLAEVDLGGGLSPQGSYTRADGCTNLYCHGNGRTDSGAVTASAGAMTCESCHAGPASGQTGWQGMSGLHALHLGIDAVGCNDCHQSVTNDGTSIAAAALHVDGSRQVAFSAAGFTMTGDRACAGTCHGGLHTGETWTGEGGRFHPLGFAAALEHGPEMELQRMDCRSCHGTTLTGAGAAPGCDGCHTANWRTDCTYCHGGGLNSTGAPPRDLGSAPSTVSTSFNAHPKHVTQGMARAFDCTQCHIKPTDVLSMNHAFDATPGGAEIRLAGGLSAAGVYDGAGGCSNLYCHGNGRGDNGTARDGTGAMTCASCHPGMGSGEARWQTMSGEHAKHLKLSGVTCGDCHNSVTTNGTTVAAPNLHIDKNKQIAFSTIASGLTWSPATRRCTGSCHGDTHNAETW